ncbi:MAG TPA: NYN domain-containing protein [Gemmatimonadales bacterium]
MKTSVYVDGFNLYFGAVRGTPYKWLDIDKICRLLLPKHDIKRIKYFTARLSGRPDDPDQPTRQQTFLRALRTIPHLEIIFGHFLTHEVTMLRADSPAGKKEYVKVIKTEEKGSDVNLATHLLRDGYRDEYEAAVLITNDSDLREPVRIVRSELKKVVGILNPHEKASRVLQGEASFMKPIRRGVLQASQFAPVLRDRHGEIRKPASW